MKLISAEEAAKLVRDGDSVLVSGSGGGHAIPERVLEAIEARYLETGSPKALTLVHIVGLGDRATKGAARFCHEGMLRRSITSALIDSPVLIDLAAADRIESYTLPQGVLSQLMREMASGRPGLITKTGLHTFIDPRQLGGRQSPSAKEDLVELMTIDGEEYLRFKPFPLDIVFLRGTTADEDGNISMEQEAIFGEMLSTAQAARRNGGIVVVQVKRMATRGALPAKTVKIPGILVDYVVVDPDQRQTYATDYNPAYSGELKVPLHALRRLPFDHRKIVARRAAMEIVPGAICNLGAGISTGISAVASEEAVLDHIVLTNEQGFIGGAPLTGPDSGASQNYDAIVDQPYQFDFYDGGGLDIAFLSFAEVDPGGNVNISRFGSKIVGVGGFINISQNAKHMVFSGTFTSGGLELKTGQGELAIAQEGRHKKFVNRIEQICYNADFARREGRTALFVTERAVFDVLDGGLQLVEIAPGIDLERDILAHMAFKPAISPELRLMDARLFRPEPMNLIKNIEANRNRRASHPARRAAE
ncbi:acyl CoA:acetate/3-ketoacid CoA transferase [Neorhizobium sp. AL 9.2.2]|uniref:acyl CoA:acetate/3-ketoacid CoA transferase n=1 Tax=Neorhizobium sp. AL 9.2.2 TaxID=2712894 RepID=UPI0015745C8A|nr:CoA-transferase [Neorhizobium sp. AL 9.2.2]NSY18543.1 3-oxoacid CoA-transferase [Neorhizobium sp. AL 9.2.2]